MSAHFLNIIKQAFKTFDQSNKASFQKNFLILKQLADELTLRDIGLNNQQEKLFTDVAFEQQSGRAPCAYVHIFENDTVSMSVFVLRNGYTMPLHDHPIMHGILRGIHGKLLVQSYTQKLKDDEPLIYDPKSLEILAYADEPRIVTADTECAVLTPRDKNFHEITAIDGVAAFFDILSPPYEIDLPGYGMRRCRYYSPTLLKPQISLDNGKHEILNTKQIQQQQTDTSNINSLMPNVASSSNKPKHLITDEQPPLYALKRTGLPRSYYCDTVETPKEVLKLFYNYLMESELNFNS